LVVLAAGASVSIKKIFTFKFTPSPPSFFAISSGKTEEKDRQFQRNFRLGAEFQPIIRAFTWYTSSEVDKSNVQDD
jgi:hypothetical protein